MVLKALCSTIALSSFFATAAIAYTFSSEQMIWRDIYGDMPRSELWQIYPEGKSDGRKVEHHEKLTELHGYAVFKRCKPRVEILHPEQRVTGLIIRPGNNAKSRACHGDVRRALLTRFGEPTSQMTSETRTYFGGPSTTETITWVLPQMTVRWLHNDLNDRWHVKYETSEATGADQL